MTDKERNAKLDGISDNYIRQHFQTAASKKAQARNKIYFGGVYANDTLTAPQKNHVYILNIQNQGEPGSHWTALYNGHYFDSYGIGPTQAIQRFTKDWNTHCYQSYNQESCGFYAMYIADQIINKRDPLEGLIPYEHASNERVLKQHFY